jgi:hypothetical protein
MRHIIHTCLLALRLISSVDSVNAQTASYNFFDNELLNNAYHWIFVSAATEPRRKDYTAAKFNINQQQTA